MSDEDKMPNAADDEMTLAEATKTTERISALHGKNHQGEPMLLRQAQGECQTPSKIRQIHISIPAMPTLPRTEMQRTLP